MPGSGIEDINNYLIGRESAKYQADKMAQMQEAIQRRQMMNDAMKMYMMMNSPAAGRLALQRQKMLAQQQDDAEVLRMMNILREEDFPPEYRSWYRAWQMTQNPNLARQLLKQAKPHGMTLKEVPITNPSDPYGPPLISREWVNPMTGTVTAATPGGFAGPASLPPSAGVASPAAVPPKTLPTGVPSAAGTLEVPPSGASGAIDYDKILKDAGF